MVRESTLRNDDGTTEILYYTSRQDVRFAYGVSEKQLQKHFETTDFVKHTNKNVTPNVTGWILFEDIKNIVNEVNSL